MDEDDEIRRVKELSLITAKEDEERRKKRQATELSFLSVQVEASKWQSDTETDPQNAYSSTRNADRETLLRSKTHNAGSSSENKTVASRIASMPYSSSLPDFQKSELNENSNRKTIGSVISRPRPQPITWEPQSSTMRSRSPSPSVLQQQRQQSLSSWSSVDKGKKVPPPRPLELPKRGGPAVGTSVTPTGSTGCSTSSGNVSEDAPLISLSPPRVSLDDLDITTFDPLGSEGWSGIGLGSKSGTSTSSQGSSNGPGVPVIPPRPCQGMTGLAQKPSSSVRQPPPIGFNVGPIPGYGIDTPDASSNIYESISGFSSGSNSGNFNSTSSDRTYASINSIPSAPSQKGFQPNRYAAFSNMNIQGPRPYPPQTLVNTYAGLGQYPAGMNVTSMSHTYKSLGPVSSSGSTQSNYPSQTLANNIYASVHPSGMMSSSEYLSPKVSASSSSYPLQQRSLSDSGSQAGSEATTPEVFSAEDNTYMSLLAETQASAVNHVSAMPKISQGDLIEFADEMGSVHDYLSLEMFDPLYAPEKPPVLSNETKGLICQSQAFALAQYQPKTAQEPSSHVKNQENAMDVLKQISAHETHKEPTLTESQKVTTQDDDMTDPFSLSYLNSLQEQQKAVIMRKKPEKMEDKDKGDMKAKRETPKRLSRMQSMRGRAMMSQDERLTELTDNTEDELKSFCQMVAGLKLQFPHSERGSNVGHVVSSVMSNPPKLHKMTVKLQIKADFTKEPIVFTCDLNAMVEHVISHVLVSTTDDLGSNSTDDYALRVHGLEEYLDNNTVLGNYEYVRNCLKMDEEIKFTILDAQSLKRPLLRKSDDDTQAVLVPRHREMENKALQVTKDHLNILMETYYKEVDRLRDQALQSESSKVVCTGVVQSVKAIQAKLSKIETIDVIKAVSKLQGVTSGKNIQMAGPNDRESFIYVTPGEEPMQVTGGSGVDGQQVSPSMVQLDDLYLAIEELTGAIKNMIELYCTTFHTDFRFESNLKKTREKKDVTGVLENLIIHIASLHRIPDKWKTTYEDYKLDICLYHGHAQLCERINTQAKPTMSDGFQDSLVWDEWIQFEDVVLGTLPREARLTFTLIGVKTVQSGSEQSHKVNTALGWVALPVFNFKFELVQGSQLLGLWPGRMAEPVGTPISNTEVSNSVLLQVNLPDFDCDVSFPPVLDVGPSVKQSFTALHPDIQEQLQAILDKDPLSNFSKAEAELLWEKRNHLCDIPEALPIVLRAVHTWDWVSLTEVYSVLESWKPMAPLKAIQLLLPDFPDTHTRTKAVKWIEQLPGDELVDYLPFLVQALKFESYHNSALARLLLELAITNIRVAHQLYWLLREAAEDPMFRKRYQLMFGALMSVVGGAMKGELSKEEDLVKMLGSVAEKVKVAKDREMVLHRELEIVWDFLQHEAIRLPLNPGMQTCGVDIKSCSYFTSKTFPLKLVLHNIDRQAEPLYTMFKSGDDLRQDMLTMQLIRIMDKLWLQEGLDLKIVTFKCQPTSMNKGLVEIVTEAETLRKIQVRYGHGIVGSFKDSTIAQWLQAQNPTELEYEKAVDNFTASCAGYCVATYVLGICDRHNDNIMIKQSGHMFHIDFGKFLGDSQMFGNIKRDRVPFVLTSDMAYVINGGDRPSQRFQQFVDLCCQAFNILRRHTNLLITLFLLMSRSGIPGVTEGAAKYVQRVLLPEHTDPEATAVFTRMIQESLKSLSTQINFFFHNLAQMKFSGHAEGALLSFIPKTYSMQTDGHIRKVEIHGYQKRYNPEKYYIYIIKIERDNQNVQTYIFRKYSEFCELHSKLVSVFPLAKIPSLPLNRVLLGRTHVRAVAATRKAELVRFLDRLFKLPPEISQSDLVYTFFHSMLRDEQDIDKTDLKKLKERSPPKRHSISIEGQVKLSMYYKNDAFTVMVQHVKDLNTHSGEPPTPYVKTYLQPDPGKLTKRKTSIAHSTFHPTYNEMLIYRVPLEELKQKFLQVTVLNYDKLSENEFLGAALIKLSDLDLVKGHEQWYHLQNLHHLQTRH